MRIVCIKDIDVRKNLETLREQFLSTISHELRTPLTAILGSVAMLDNSDVVKLLPENEQANLTSNIHNNAKKLHMLINDLLDMQKMEAGLFHYEFAMFDLKLLIEQTVKELSGLVSNTEKSFCIRNNCERKVSVEGDRVRIGQVLTNFLSNALKFSPDDGTVLIEMSNDDNNI